MNLVARERFVSRLWALPQRVPRLTLVAVAVPTVILGVFAAQFRVDSAVDQLLPTNDPDRSYYEAMRATFGSEEIAVVGIFADDVFTPSTLSRIQRLTRQLSRIDGVRSVESLTTLEWIKLDADGLGRQRLMPPLPHTPGDTRTFRRRALAHQIGRHVIVSPDGRVTGLVVRFEPASDAVFLRRGIAERIRAAVAACPGPEGVAITGLPVIKAQAAHKMRQDLAVFVPLGILVVVLVLVSAFRTWRGVLLPLSTVLVGVVWTTGVMVLAGGAFTMGTLVLPPLLMAVGVAYSIHIVSRYYHDMGSDRTTTEVVAAAMAEVRLPVAMAAATTVAGFASFIWNPIPSTRDFGVYSALGITIILIASLTVIPAALTLSPGSVGPPAQPRARGWVTRVLEGSGQLAIRYRWAMVLAGIALMVASLWGIGRIRIETDYLRFFSPASAVRRENERIGAALVGTQLIAVGVDGDRPESVTRVAVLAALRQLRRFIEEQPGVDKAISVSDYLDMLRRAVEPEDAEEPLRDQPKVDQLLLLLNPKDIERTVSRDFSRAQLAVYTRLSGSREIHNLVKRIEAFGTAHFPADVRVHVSGTVVLLNRSADALARTQVASLGQVFVILLVLMGLLFRSLRLGLLSLVPNVIPIVILFGIMGWAGIDLNIATSMIAAISVGIAVDDTIHYLSAYRADLRRAATREAAIRNTVRTVGRPILITSVALSAGFLIVCLSNFQPIRYFGILASMTMAVALIADLLLLPALLLVARVGEPAGRGV
ncbi:MAG: RND family transporter [Candidatus Binatia bacterium]